METNTNGNSGLLQLVSFKIGQEEFCIDILKVQEITKLVQITQVPNSPDFVDGVVNLRGKIIPIICMRTRLSLPKIDNNKDTRIIVIELNNKTVGFIVDGVSEVLRISKDIIEAPPEITKGINSDYITAVAKLEDRLLILLDLERLLTVEEESAVEAL